MQRAPATTAPCARQLCTWGAVGSCSRCAANASTHATPNAARSHNSCTVPLGCTAHATLPQHQSLAGEFRYSGGVKPIRLNMRSCSLVTQPRNLTSAVMIGLAENPWRIRVHAQPGSP